MRSASPTTGDGPANWLVVPAKIRPPAADALPRERLEVRLHELWSHRLGLVVAPAGSGKSTLMARFADPRRRDDLSGAIEADGPAGDGKVTLGCLTPGLTYNFVIDAIGDAGGPLGVELVQP